VFRNFFKSTGRNSVIRMEIFDLEGRVVKEKGVSEALSLLWTEFERVIDIEAFC
jgi:hypothetical protein